MSYNLSILGIDPGKITGAFNIRVTSGVVSHFGYELETNEVFTHVYDAITEANESHVPLHVYVERYLITRKTAQLSQQTDALEVIGRLKAAHEYTQSLAKQDSQSQLDTATMTLVMKAHVSKLMSDDLLKKAGWYTPSSRHVSDAAKMAGYGLYMRNALVWAMMHATGEQEESNGLRRR